jgi:transcription elongation factor Elf1
MGLNGWLRARRSESARLEGRAAGTGLMIGRVADELSPAAIDCPECGERAIVTDAIDLVEGRTLHHCQACRHRWAVATA